MKRIKRAVAVLLAVMMVFSVIGCGGSSGSKKSDSSSKETKDAKTEEVWGNKSGQDEICGDPDGKYTIGVVIHTTTDFLCAKYKAYTDYLGKAYGVKFNYYIIENFADETYLSAIENLCAQGVTLYPILYTFKLSFMSWDGFGEQQFIGLANYQRLLQDQMFIKSIGNTIFIALLAMIPQMVFGLVLAFLLNQKKLRGSNFFKTVFYFPNLVTAVSLGVLFSLLFDWKAGSVNQVLMTLHIIKDPINWKGSPLLSQLIVALVLFWQYFGYYTIIFTAGIRGIPYELFEAAEVDGASKVQTFFKIVLPLMRPIMTFAFVTSIIGGLQIFDLPYTFGGAMGGTKASLLTMVMYMYNIAFTNLDYGYGAAISYGLFVIIIVFSIIFMKYTTGKKEQY